MKHFQLFATLLFLVSLQLFAQKIDNFSSYHKINDSSYFRFHYDNDYFTSTDENYTQGYSFEIVLQDLKKNPLNAFLLNDANASQQFGLSIDHIGYTPFNIGSTEIQFGDRPFASAIMLKSFKINTNAERKSRLISAIRLGLIGPGAFGKEMQVGIHEATGNTIPQGWKNQIKNDAVVNYEVIYQKEIFAIPRYFSFQYEASANLGTLNTNASAGIVAMAGLFNNPFSNKQNRKFQIYIYSKPQATFVGYDASLQGGLFNRKSPYTIASSNVERVVGQNHFGMVVQTKTLYFEYTTTDITKEFSSGTSASWGGIKIGFTF
ncbi:lipid A deacylase LpxR family protein [Flavobacterium antarcticum]|uniref:lipid A deacylase LpxR family protein n=1 Tax=Flavobacterium antarcticum TaxID=271155 RepID=UPI0003B6279A|nr:lipid A deacylase LpxR family protein [Flavobacterium antarcticum]